MTSINHFHSSLIPIHWSKCQEIINMLILIHNGLYDEEWWYLELITYMMVAVSDSTHRDTLHTFARNAPNVIIPNFINQKIFDIMESIYNSIIYSILHESDIDDQIWDDYENMLLFECSIVR
jgi:hypothetical protein